MPSPDRPTFQPHTSSPEEASLLAEAQALHSKIRIWDTWIGGDQEGTKPPEPTPEEYQRAQQIVDRILVIRQPKPPTPERRPTPELSRLLSTSCQALQNSLNTRFAQFSRPETVTIPPSSIELPPGLTKEHLDAIAELFPNHPNAFIPTIVPTLASLNNLDAGYEAIMYPKTKQSADKQAGLISFRPARWNKPVAKNIIKGTFTKNKTHGKAYLHSMRHQLSTLGGKLILIDSATKPDYNNGSQHYGSKEGIDPTRDPLLPFFQQAFGPTANRFNHTHDQLTQTLLPHIQNTLEQHLSSKGLPPIPFKVILIPSTLENLHLTFQNKTSSTTNTWEWSSTPP